MFLQQPTQNKVPSQRITEMSNTTVY